MIGLLLNADHGGHGGSLDTFGDKNLVGVFSQIFDFIVNVFRSVLQWLDSIYILNGVSLLRFNIGLTIMTLIFTVVFAVVRNGVNVGSRRRSQAGSKAGSRRSEGKGNNDD